ncbi:MAG: lipid A deacylase LpxR family protein [Verrucomicrobiae bacterium]|nr:lipid A deacylase LpxR family protein [Verrucomicrobiae bacterium]
MTFKTVLLAGFSGLMLTGVLPAQQANSYNTSTLRNANSGLYAGADTSKRMRAVAVREEKFTFTLLTENDGALWNPGGNDKWYSFGVGTYFTHQPQFAADFWSVMPFNDYFSKNNASFGAGYRFTIQGYTPENKTIAFPQPADHSYAGVMMVGMNFQRATEHDQDFLEFAVGTTGQPSLAHQLQNWVHSWSNNGQSQGWGQQVRQEFGFDVTYGHKWKGELYRAGDNFGIQAIPRVAATAGTFHRNIVAGNTFRLGWNLPDDFGMGRMSDLGSATGAKNDADFGGYFFATFQGRAVEHDIAIDGSDFRGTIVRQKVEPLVGELSLGAAVYLWKNFEVSYAWTAYTKDWKAMPKDYYQYGAWNLKYSW